MLQFSSSFQTRRSFLPVPLPFLFPPPLLPTPQPSHIQEGAGIGTAATTASPAAATAAAAHDQVLLREPQQTGALLGDELEPNWCASLRARNQENCCYNTYVLYHVVTPSLSPNNLPNKVYVIFVRAVRFFLSPNFPNEIFVVYTIVTASGSFPLSSYRTTILPTYTHPLPRLKRQKHFAAFIFL